MVNHTRGTNGMRVIYAGVHSFTNGGRGGISSASCNNNVNVVVTTGPICRYCGDLCGRGRGGPRLICLSPGNAGFARRGTVRFSEVSQLMLLYNRCRNVSRHIVSRVISRRVSVNSFILANNRLPTLAITSTIYEVLPNILSRSVYFRRRDRFSKLLRCPRCAGPTM